MGPSYGVRILWPKAMQKYNLGVAASDFEFSREGKRRLLFGRAICKCWDRLGQFWFVRKTAIHSLYVILLLTPVTKLDIIDVTAHHMWMSSLMTSLVYYSLQLL